MARETNGWLHIICYAKQTHNTISTFLDMNDAIKQEGEKLQRKKIKMSVELFFFQISNN